MPRVPLIVSLLLVAGALALSAWLYPALPDQIPTHWNIHGEADGFGPKAVAAWILAAALVRRRATRSRQRKFH